MNYWRLGEIHVHHTLHYSKVDLMSKGILFEVLKTQVVYKCCILMSVIKIFLLCTLKVRRLELTTLD